MQGVKVACAGPNNQVLAGVPTKHGSPVRYSVAECPVFSVLTE